MILIGFLLPHIASPCKISEPYDISFWQKRNDGRRKERRKILNFCNQG
jgi:hypothetical protein